MDVDLNKPLRADEVQPCTPIPKPKIRNAEGANPALFASLLDLKLDACKPETMNQKL